MPDGKRFKASIVNKANAIGFDGPDGGHVSFEVPEEGIEALKALVNMRGEVLEIVVLRQGVLDREG